jgi:hypothetical protein
MKRVPSELGLELALVASDLQRTTRRSLPQRRQRLLDQLVEAGRQDDRAEFDRIFDRCFKRVYALAWRVTRERARAEAITAQILCAAGIKAARGRR